MDKPSGTDQAAFPGFINLAIERGLVNAVQLNDCRELVIKGRSIGLEMSLEEVLVKQRVLSEEAVCDLKEMAELTDGGGTVFGPYRLKKLMGEGGMGKVYEGLHEFMGRVVAVKVLSSRILNEKSPVSRFLREVRALAKLSHPHIVTMYDAGKLCGKCYYAMELFSGADLKSFSDAKGRLPETEALAIIRSIALALGYAHDKSIVHRDVKPENIMIDAQGSPKITDFGLVMNPEDEHSNLTREGHWVGTYHYTSPEQVEGKRDLDGRSDIYSLGATFYYILTGKTLYSGETVTEVLTHHMAGGYVSPRRYAPNISGKTIRLLKRMLAVDRDERFQTMSAVVAAIDRKSFVEKNGSAIAGFIAVIGSVALGMAVEHFFGVFRDFLP